MRTPDVGMRQVYKGEIEEKLSRRRTDLTGIIMPPIAAKHNRFCWIITFSRPAVMADAYLSGQQRFAPTGTIRHEQSQKTIQNLILYRLPGITGVFGCLKIIRQAIPILLFQALLQKRQFLLLLFQ